MFVHEYHTNRNIGWQTIGLDFKINPERFGSATINQQHVLWGLIFR